METTKNGRYIGSISDLHEPIRKTDTHHVFKCPYCDSVHGKTADREGKMYYSPTKKVGFCFRCESVILNKDPEDVIETVKTAVEEESESDKILRENITKYNKQVFDLSWTKGVLDNKMSKDYLIGERGINENVIKDFDIRSCTNPTNGVVFVDKVTNNSTNFFQIRNIVSEKHNRHLFIKGCIKPISWTDRIDKTKGVILCEGFISALSAYQHLEKDINPLVATGKTITRFQLHLLSLVKNNIKEFTVCYDGGFVKEAVRTAGVLHNFGFPIYIMNLLKEKDPNDVSKEEFVDCFNRRVLYSPLKESLLLNFL